MNKTTRQKNKAKEKLDNFSARGSRCPICHKTFRTDCNHTVLQARDRLFENYIKSINEEEV